MLLFVYVRIYIKRKKKNKKNK